MTVMARESKAPTLCLWEEPGTVMGRIWPVSVSVEGADGAEEEALTLYVCDISEDAVSELLRKFGYVRSEVRPQPCLGAYPNPPHQPTWRFTSMPLCRMQVTHAATEASGVKRRHTPGASEAKRQRAPDQQVSTRPEQPFIVFIETPTGRTFKYSLPHDLITLDTNRHTIAHKLDTPAGKLRLMAGDGRLQDSQTLRSYIQEGRIWNGGVISVLFEQSGC